MELCQTISGPAFAQHAGAHEQDDDLPGVGGRVVGGDSVGACLLGVLWIAGG